MISDILTCILAVAAFVIGALRFFRKGQPLYFMILICATGCFAVGLVANLVYALCNGFIQTTDFTISVFSYLGGGAFILTANLGALDRSVYAKTSRKRAILSLAAPVLYLVLVVLFAVVIMPADLLYGIVSVLFLLPNVVNAYCNFRHLLTPPDENGILSGIRGVDIFSLLFCILSVLCLLFYGLGNNTLPCDLTELGAALASFAIVISAIRGVKKWKI